MKNQKIRKTYVCWIVICILFIFVYFGVAFYMRDQLIDRYNEAITLYNRELYSEAKTIFDDLRDYKDSDYYSQKTSDFIKYNEAKQLRDDKHYKEAAELFSELGTFEDSAELLTDTTYLYGIELYLDGCYDEAAKIFLELGDYKDSHTYLANTLLPSIDEIQETVYQEAKDYYEKKQFAVAYEQFLKLKDYKDSIELAQKCCNILKRLQLSHTLVAGIRGSMALKGNGEIGATALNNDQRIIYTGDIPKELLDFSDWGNVVSISYAGVVVAGLREDGTVIASSADPNIDSVNSWTDIIAIATGERFVVGLTETGEVVGAGHNGDKQINFSGWENIIAISAAWRRTVGLDSEGGIHITGYGSANHLKQIEEANQRAENSVDQEVIKKAWTDIIDIATGLGYEDDYGHTVGLKSDGTVVAVGNNDYGQCDVDGWTEIVAIAAGDYHTVGLKRDGTVMIAGKCDENSVNSAGEIIGWSDIVSITANVGYTLALTRDGHVKSIGYHHQNQRPDASDQSWENIIVYKEWLAYNE